MSLAHPTAEALPWLIAGVAVVVSLVLAWPLRRLKRQRDWQRCKQVRFDPLTDQISDGE
jgi:hypothetical protein